MAKFKPTLGVGSANLEEKYSVQMPQGKRIRFKFNNWITNFFFLFKSTLLVQYLDI